MDLTVAVALLLAAALAVTLALAIRQRRRLDRVARLVHAAPGQDLEMASQALLDERDRARQQVAQADQELGQLAGLLGVGVLRFDDDLRVRFANPAACTFLGREPGGLEGRSALEAFADHEVEALLLSARERGASGGEVRPHGEDGRALLIRARRSPGGGLWVALDDVTKLRRLERIRTEFVDNLSHELRTPLTSVRLLTETLARDLDDLVVPDRVRDRVARIDVETGHLVQMVSELLELSRIEAGGQRLFLDVVDMAEVVRASCERLRLFAERQGIRLEVRTAADLPLVRGDAERLGQVLLNLVHNALKFSPSGTTVTVSAVVQADRVEVSVADQGPGIARADQARIFERFYKVDRARVRGMGGTGLGLAIARHIVEDHGGRLELESAEGHGATFRFGLPIAADLATGPGDRPWATQPAGSSS
ncbi:MAG TPA: ATP-binding protein [Candidatus Baltobacteraceae bacterium]|nr:ATP-binding protein [Candidatus Baltobacteraceae bacterium]